MYVDTHGTYPITSSDAVVFNLDTGFEMTLVDLVADPMSVLESAEEAWLKKSNQILLSFLQVLSIM